MGSGYAVNDLKGGSRMAQTVAIVTYIAPAGTLDCLGSIQIQYTVICGIGACSVSKAAEPFVTV